MTRMVVLVVCALALGVGLLSGGGARAQVPGLDVRAKSFQTTEGSALTPRLNSSVAADRQWAVPGTSVVSNAGARVSVQGTWKLLNGGIAAGSVSGWHTYVTYFSAAENAWVPLAGHGEGSVPATAPASSGLSVSTTPVPASGVTYAPSPRGTSIGAGRQAQWKYSSRFDVGPAVARKLDDAGEATATTPAPNLAASHY